MKCTSFTQNFDGSLAPKVPSAHRVRYHSGHEKCENGEPTGWIRERAQTLLWDKVPEATEAELRGALLKSLKELLELGITRFNDAGVVVENLARFQDVYAEHGLELPRATLQVRLPRDKPVDEMLAVLKGIPFHTGFGTTG
jgi:predicted amidohydrolase YtcJ